MLTKRAPLISALAIFLSLPAALFAGDKLIHLHGNLADAQDNPVTGNRQVTFRLYQNIGDTTPAWQDTLDIPFDAGAYNVSLGQNTSLDGLLFNRPYYLGLQVAGDSQEAGPRQMLGSAVYALGSLGDFHANKNVLVAGNLGVGTSAPQTPLDLYSAAAGAWDAALRLKDSASSFAWRLNACDSAGEGNCPANGLVIHQDGVATRMAFTPGGNVGIGTVSPVATLQIVGSLTTSGSKNFTIGHPLNPDKLLVHSSVESPEQGLIYRGKGGLRNGVAEILLPDYFESLALPQDRTVQLTCLDGYSPLYVAGKIENGRFTVRAAPGGNQSQEFYWMVQAKRGDPEAQEDPFRDVIDKPEQPVKQKEWNDMTPKNRGQLQRLYKLNVIKDDEAQK